MKFIRSLPEMWARMMWPFPMSTLNVVLGRASVTTPSNSIISSFAKASYLHVVSNLRQRSPELSVSYRLSGPDFFKSGVLTASNGSHVLDVLPLGTAHPPSFPISQQQPLAVRVHDTEQLSAVVTAQRSNDLGFFKPHTPVSFQSQAVRISGSPSVMRMVFS